MHDKSASRPEPSGAPTPVQDHCCLTILPQLRVMPDVLHAMIAEAAYYRAQQRGFAPGHELEDWLAAEQEALM